METSYVVQKMSRQLRLEPKAGTTTATGKRRLRVVLRLA
jgi:hypothetical protein